jgi:ABC-type sugar transport system permease subunit
MGVDCEAVFPARPLALPLLAPLLVAILWVGLWPGAAALAEGARALPGALADGAFRAAIATDLATALGAALGAMLAGLALALAAAGARAGRGILAALVIWPAAVAPGVAALAWTLAAREAPAIAARAVTAVEERTAEALDTLALLFGVEAGPLDPGLATALGTLAESPAVILGLALGWTLAGLAALVLIAAIRAIPARLIEAAMLDHAGPWRRFGALTLPLLRPVIARLLPALFVLALFGLQAAGQGSAAAMSETAAAPGEAAARTALHALAAAAAVAPALARLLRRVAP